MIIRSFMEADREALQQIYLDSRLDTFTWLEPASMRLSDFDRHTLSEAIWVAEREGTVVGFVSVDEGDNFIHNLFVMPQWVGHGIGSQLLAIALENIAGPARLKCLVANARAIAFYHANGWQKMGQGISEDGKYDILKKWAVPDPKRQGFQHGKD
ncbi:MAG: GNAT family N-acetyltransferase [Gammaproteobacteria bacterium]|nr:GNAT family N-acetyltransferase [Gammaproteobacteria bacterium]